MNKQELIEQIKGLKNLFGNKAEYIKIDTVIELASKLDEPQKVTIPQFVANYIEYAKVNEWDLLGAMNNVAYEDDKDLRTWFNNNTENFALAWIDGYTVEEKRYLVKMKDITISTRYLKHNMQSGNWFLSEHKEALPYRTKHTRKDLERANFGWVFDCPGIEIEEVEG